jgi:hypothetical protein
MGKAIPAQHPAVVLRSHYRQLRALLAIAMIAVVGLTAAVVILATGEDRETTIQASSQPTAQERVWSAYDQAISDLTPRELEATFDRSSAAPATRYDGGPEEGTAVIRSSSSQPAGIRYDGGPEEGTAATRSSSAEPPAGIRYDGGPEEGTAVSSR